MEHGQKLPIWFATKSKSGSLNYSSAGEPDGVPNWPTGVPNGAGCVALRTVWDGVVESLREGDAAVRTWSRLRPRSVNDVRVIPRPTYIAMVILLQILKLEIGVRVVCKGFWGLGGPSTPSGPPEIRGARSGGLGRTPKCSFHVIY